MAKNGDSLISKNGTPESTVLLNDIRVLVDEAKTHVAQTVNVGLTMLYWRIGKRIRDELTGNKRAEYGSKVVITVSLHLVKEYGNNFAEKNLRRMMQFAGVFPDEQIVVTLLRHLSWSHFIALLPLKQPLQREFYAEMCRIERWSVRLLRKKIDSMLYERTALSKKPEELAKQELSALRESDQLSPNLVFRDPYFLDFLGLKGSFHEKDLEEAILRELENFLLELGAGFTFVARQKRIIIDADDFYIDLLMYHRDLRRLIVVELKLGQFKAEYKGQIELYLRWIDKHERKEGEGSPLGIILCADKNSERVELLELDKSGIHVAEYYTLLPPKDLLEQKLHAAIERSRAHFDNTDPLDE